MRAFIALELPWETKKALGELCARLAGTTRGYRWAKADAMHLTLRFLGDVEEARLASIAGLVDAGLAARGPFHLTPLGVGGFPSLMKPRVIWAGLGGETDKLKALVAALDDGLASLAIPRESRPFAAHLTLGREKRGERTTPLEGIEELAKWRGPAFTTTELVLFESELKPGGALHTERARGKIN